MNDLEQRINGLETKVESIGTKVTEGFELILSRLDSIDLRISDLKGDAKTNLGTVENVVNNGFKDVINELKKLNHVTGYVEKHNNLPKPKGEA